MEILQLLVSLYGMTAIISLCIAYAVLCVIGYFLYYYAELGFGGAPLRSDSFFKDYWHHLKTDYLMFLPGGLARRTEMIRKETAWGSGLFPGKEKGHPYWYEEIREGNLYEEVAKRYYGPAWRFWITQFACFFLLGPLISYLFFVIVLIIGIAYLCLGWSRQFQWSPPNIVWW